MEGALAIVGGIGVVVQLSQIIIRLAHDWKDAPQSAKSFVAELEALRSILEHTTTNLVLNSEFVNAFEGRDSALLKHLGDDREPHSTIRQSLDTCQRELENLVAVLRKRASNHKFGLDRIKSAFVAGDLRNAVSQLTRQSKAINSLVSLDTASLAAATLNELSSVRKDLQDHHVAQLQASVGIQQAVSDVHQHLAAQVANREVQDSLAWLSPSDYSTRHSDLASRGQQGTGKWLLKSRHFQAWLSGREQTLYCPGMPDAGKTTLLSMIVDYITANFGQHSGTGVAFLYLDLQRKHEQNAVEILARLLRQVAETSGQYSAVLALRDRHKTSHTRPSVAHLAAALSDVVSAASRCFILIDALDECQKPDRRLLLDTLLPLQRGKGVQLFCTSRFDPQISAYFSNSSRLEIRASDEDVSLFLRDHMKELPAFVHRDPGLQVEVETTILTSVQGMFLLARLHLNSLVGTRSIKSLRKTLGSLPHGPEGYDQAYDGAMHRIDQQGCSTRNFAHQILSWIVGTRRPLSLLELRHALAIEINEPDMDEDNLPDADDILSACAGLVIIDEKSNIVRLVHHTTQEYFQRTWRGWFPEIHNLINNACLTYLSFAKFRKLCPSRVEVDKRLLSYPLYYYACHYWGYHALQASPKGGVIPAHSLKEKGTWASALQAKVVGYRRTLEDSFENFPFKSDGSGEMIKDLDPKHLYLSSLEQQFLKSACDGSVERIDESLGMSHSGSDDTISAGTTPPQTGSTKVKSRQASPVDINYYRTTICDIIAADGIPLHGATLNASSEVINGLDPVGRAPLHMACELGRAFAVKQLLAVPDIDPNTTNIAGETPLIAAVRMGHENIVESLLSLDSTLVYDTDKDDLSALIWAVIKGQRRIVELLLDLMPSTNPQYDFWTGTALLYAATNGHTNVVELLLNKKEIDPNQTYALGETALWVAADRGHCDTVDLLIGLDAVDVDHRDNSGQTALMRACQPGSEEIVSILIEKGCCNVNATDMDGRHALYYAIRWRSDTTVETLLRAAPSAVNIQSLGGYTPLHWAAEENSEHVVGLLLRWGARVNARAFDGITPLMCAASYFSTGVAECLLQAGADVALVDDDGANLLHHCARRGGTYSLEFFLEAVKNAGSPQIIGARDHWGNNLLHHSLSGVDCVADTLDRCRADSLDRVVAVQCLLVHEISVQERNFLGMTPLAQYLDVSSPLIPNKEICELLFQKGSDADWRSSTGQSLAHLYLQGRDDYMSLEVLRTLEFHGVNMRAVDNNGQTILHYLVRHQGLTADIMDYLLQHTMLDVDHSDSQGRTAIQLLNPEPADLSDLSNTEKEVETLRAILRMSVSQSTPEPDDATTTGDSIMAGL